MDANSRAEYVVRIREEERARIRREEVEPLREALREMLAEAEAYEENGSRFDRERNERARAALRAADESSSTVSDRRCEHIENTDTAFRRCTRNQHNDSAHRFGSWCLRAADESGR